MGVVKVRENFHEAKWDEPIIFELSTKGNRGILLPEFKISNKEYENILSRIPKSLKRKSIPDLPELSQPVVLRHYLRLSQEVLGVGVSSGIGHATSTTKYSPKINELFVRSHKISELHPMQDLNTIQGALEIIYKLDLLLRKLSGFEKFTFQPRGGAHAIYTMSSIIKRYHEVHKNNNKDEIITTYLSHPADAAAPRVKGFKIIDIMPESDTGIPDINAFRDAISERTAGMIVCNPEDTEIFNPYIKEMTKLIHDVGGLNAYDMANGNGVIGIIRPADLGFDMGFYNLHKTFSSPHGSGGPGGVALGVTKNLIDYLPIPVVEYDKENKIYYFNYDIKYTIGKVAEYYGGIPAIIRAYAWIMSLGEEGIKNVSRTSILNNNYLIKKILNEIKSIELPFPKSNYRVGQTRFSLQKIKEETGVSSEDIIRRMTDFGFNIWPSHHPYLVREPISIEPTESYPKEDLDEFVEALKIVVKESYENPQKVKNSPYQSTIHKINNINNFINPKEIIPTWRVFLKKLK